MVGLEDVNPDSPVIVGIASVVSNFRGIHLHSW